MTSNPYTPDETELRDCYAASLHEHAGEDYATAKADAERGIAKIKADALREAANMIGGKCGPRGGVRMADEIEWAEWLSARANEVEEQERQ